MKRVFHFYLQAAYLTPRTGLPPPLHLYKLHFGRKGVLDPSKPSPGVVLR